MVNINRARSERLLWVAIILIIVVASAVCLQVSVSTFPDSGRGFSVWKNMQQGGAFNIMPEVEPDNLAVDQQTFLAWWSPGQYLIPGYIASFIGAKIGWGMILTSILFTVSGVAGCYFLFDKLRFNRLTTLISVLVLCCQVQTLLPFTNYNGGEVLIFGVAPWFWFCCIDFKLRPWRLLFLVLLSWIGFIAKSTFMLITLSGFLFIFLSWISKRITSKELFIKAGGLALAGLAIFGPIYFLFLKKGINPSTVAGSFSFEWINVLYPAGTPLLTAFSIDEVLGKVAAAQHFSPLYTGIHVIAFLLAFFALSRIYYNRIGSVAYRWLLFTTYILLLCFFTMQYCRHAAISMEGRHFRILGLLFLPGIIQLIRQIRIYALKRALQLILVFLCGFGLVSHYFNIKIKSKQPLSTKTHVIQEFIDQQAMDKLHQLDANFPHKALFVLMTPEIAMEVTQNRTLVLPFNSMPVGEDKTVYDGRVNKLFLFIPTHFVDGKTLDSIKSCFNGYKKYRQEKISQSYLLYTGL